LRQHTASEGRVERANKTLQDRLVKELRLQGVQAVLGFLWVTVAGHLSDRIGRKRMYIIGCVFMAIFGFIYFALLDTKVPGLIFLAVAVSELPVMTLYGPEAALIAESFSPRLRYSGCSLGYQLASIIAADPVQIDARRRYQETAAEAAGSDEHGLPRSGAFDPAAEQRADTPRKTIAIEKIHPSGAKVQSSGAELVMPISRESGRLNVEKAYA
jgi:hypothetical protein